MGFVLKVCVWLFTRGEGEWSLPLSSLSLCCFILFFAPSMFLWSLGINQGLSKIQWQCLRKWTSELVPSMAPLVTLLKVSTCQSNSTLCVPWYLIHNQCYRRCYTTKIMIYHQNNSNIAMVRLGNIQQSHASRMWILENGLNSNQVGVRWVLD